MRCLVLIFTWDKSPPYKELHALHRKLGFYKHKNFDHFWVRCDTDINENVELHNDVVKVKMPKKKDNAHDEAHFYLEKRLYSIEFMYKNFGYKYDYFICMNETVFPVINTLNKICESFDCNESVFCGLGGEYDPIWGEPTSECPYKPGQKMPFVSMDCFIMSTSTVSILVNGIDSMINHRIDTKCEDIVVCHYLLHNKNLNLNIKVKHMNRTDIENFQRNVDWAINDIRINGHDRGYMRIKTLFVNENRLCEIDIHTHLYHMCKDLKLIN